MIHVPHALPDHAYPSLSPEALSLLTRLLKNLERWRDFTRLSLDLLFETDANGKLTSITPLSWADPQVENLLGQDASSLWSQGNKEKFEPNQTYTREFVSKHLKLTAFPLRDPEGKLLGSKGGLVKLSKDTENPNSRLYSEKIPLILDRILQILRTEAPPRKGIQSAFDVICQELNVLGGALLESGFVSNRTQDEEAKWKTIHQNGKIHHDFILPDADYIEGDEQKTGQTGQTAWSWNCFSVRISGHIAFNLHRSFHHPFSREEQQFLEMCGHSFSMLLAIDEDYRRLLQDAPYDLSTHLLTWEGFRQEVQRRLSRLDREQLPGTVMMIKVEGIARLSTSKHALARDEALRQIATMLRDAVRPTDLIGRINADTFVLWMNGGDRFVAAERAELLFTHGAPVILDKPMHFPVRIGLVTREPETTEPLDVFLERASLALREAHRDGVGWRFSHDAP
ncbi:GGDEF domain-containing protein [Kozakia baliensis]|uniref:GGDEF domain-containing protein n=1 Tax=Kozakia baliensis TaxID=153496 RepID=UPI00345C2064